MAEVDVGQGLSTQQVTNAIEDLSIDQTRKLIFQLGVPLNEIDSIRDGELAKARLVQLWLNSDTSASWEKLVSELKKIKMETLAKRIERKHVRKVTTEHLPTPPTSPRVVSIPRSRDEGVAYVSDRQVKILLCGDGNVGKTSLLHQFADNAFQPTYIATIGVDCKLKTITIGGQQVRMQIFDLAGQDRFYPITAQYYKKADGLVLVYDITKETSFDNLTKWFSNIRENGADGAKVLLVGNKVDLANERIVSTDRGQIFAEKNGIWLFETSAVTGHNVTEAFTFIASRVLEHRQYTRNDLKISLRLEEDDRPVRRRGCCC